MDRRLPVLLLLLLSFNHTALAVMQSKPILLVRENGSVRRTIHFQWFGNPPQPVINVYADQPGGNFTFRAVRNMTYLDQLHKCTIKTGLYHPNSDSDVSIVEYSTILDRNEVMAKIGHRLGKHNIPASSRVSEILELGGGQCRGNMRGRKGTDTIEFPCQDAYNNPYFTRTQIPDHSYKEQWLHFKCREGYDGYMPAKIMLQVGGVKRGVVKKDGSVSIK